MAVVPRYRASISRLSGELTAEGAASPGSNLTLSGDLELPDFGLLHDLQVTAFTPGSWGLRAEAWYAERHEETLFAAPMRFGDEIITAGSSVRARLRATVATLSCWTPMVGAGSDWIAMGFQLGGGVRSINVRLSLDPDGSTASEAGHARGLTPFLAVSGFYGIKPLRLEFWAGGWVGRYGPLRCGHFDGGVELAIGDLLHGFGGSIGFCGARITFDDHLHDFSGNLRIDGLSLSVQYAF